MNTHTDTLTQDVTSDQVPVPSNTETNSSEALLNVPNITAPSLASSAMLVDLSISKWEGKKKDKRASKAVTTNNGAQDGVANVHKKLLGNCKELQDVLTQGGKIRNTIHYGMTLPWSDKGTRLLPTAMYFDYTTKMSGAIAEFDTLVSTFLSAYQWEISQAQAKLGSLFDITEYPTTDELASKFNVSLTYTPLPDAGDFRVDIPNDAMNEIKKTYSDYYSRSISSAMNDIWTRLHEALTRMSERLDYAGKDDKKTFRDTLVTNVMDIVNILDKCNLTNDSQMSACKNKLTDMLYGITPEVLRESDETRADTKRNIDKVIASLPSLEV